MKKLIEFFKSRKNRDIVMFSSGGLSVILAIGSVYIDEWMGKSGLPIIYAFEVLVIISMILIVAMFVINVWVKAGKKMDEKKK